MYIDMEQQPLFDQECLQEVCNQQYCSSTCIPKSKPVKIRKYKANIATREKSKRQRGISELARAQHLKHPLDDTFKVINDDEDNCSEDDYDSLDDISYSSCSSASDNFKDHQLFPNYSYGSSSPRTNSYVDNSIASCRSGISLLSLNGTTFSPSSLASTPSTTTAFLTTTATPTSPLESIEGTGPKATTPYLAPSSSPLSTSVSLEGTNTPKTTKSLKLHRTTSTECLNKVLLKYKSKQSLYSNLTVSLKSLRDRLVTTSLSDIDMSPSILDVSPSTVIDEPISPHIITDELPSQELITFFEAKHDHDTIQEYTKSPFKNRDHRINSQFLRLYAYDYNARMNSRSLPNSLSQEELVSIIMDRPHLKPFHKKHNIYHISNLSREKLWNSVVLKPRLDKSPQQNIDYEDYICTDNDNKLTYASITRKHGKYLPWDLKPSIKPAGVLPGGKWEFNGQAPNSGISKTQFTVKGWCNSRWVAKTQG
ncbi:hypothetical protein CANMA_002361 [Candida margitis]|uniref:uncharacterized protein n=1 Tax=Candida margitis TaxID=1775924 RepID=UPI00222750F7|nr:uncharacterized protein CANMA_002361 [Candida margitis]KAI5968370.1 hypothetical protein CANMA_002361 [Candida margitis]